MARQFGHTWWGAAWVEALEGRAALDPNRLPRGRTYARHDHVSRLTLEPGRISALVRGSRVLPYKVTIGVRRFDDAEWDRLVEAVAARAGNAAALLDGELDPEVVAQARAARVEILPSPGDLVPRCSCPDHADPCKHSAAVCYLVADAVDTDPFALFTVRGRDRDALMAAVRQQRAGRGAAADHHVPDGSSLVDTGVVARQAWQRWRELGGARSRVELPAPPDQAGVPAAWPADPPADAPFTAAGLSRLAEDAAGRAWAQLVEGEPSGLLLSAGADLARRAARLTDRGEPLTELGRTAGETTATLSELAAAWRHGGPEGLRVLDEGRWIPAASVVAAGRRAFEDAGVDAARIQVRSNRVTVGDVQLRVTADGRWWRYEKRGRTWELVEAPSPDPADLVSDDV